MIFVAGTAIILASLMVILLVLFFIESMSMSSDHVNESGVNIDNDRVVKVMAKKIISDASMHRRNRFMEDE
jgi:hypothetical protein